MVPLLEACPRPYDQQVGGRYVDIIRIGILFNPLTPRLLQQKPNSPKPLEPSLRIDSLRGATKKEAKQLNQSPKFVADRHFVIFFPCRVEGLWGCRVIGPY